MSLILKELFPTIISFYDNLSYRLVCRSWSLLISENFLLRFSCVKVRFRCINHMKRIPDTPFIREIIRRSNVNEYWKKDFILCMNDLGEGFDEKELGNYIIYDLDNYIKGTGFEWVSEVSLRKILLFDSVKCLKYLDREKDLSKILPLAIENLRDYKITSGSNCLIYLFDKYSEHFTLQEYATIISSPNEDEVRKILKKTKAEDMEKLKHYYANPEDKIIYNKYFL